MIPNPASPQPSCLCARITAGNVHQASWARLAGPFQGRKQSGEASIYLRQTLTTHPEGHPGISLTEPRERQPLMGSEARRQLQAASLRHLGPLTPLQGPMSRAGQAVATRTLGSGGGDLGPVPPPHGAVAGGVALAHL